MIKNWIPDFWNKSSWKIAFRNSIVLFYIFCVFSLPLHNFKMFYALVYNLIWRWLNYCSSSIILLLIYYITAQTLLYLNLKHLNSKIYEQSLLTLYFLNLFTQETSILSVSFSRSSSKILSAKSLQKEVNRIMLSWIVCY